LRLMKLKLIKKMNFFYDNSFKCIFKSRNKFGGGVDFIINKNIKFTLINDLELFFKYTGHSLYILGCFWEQFAHLTSDLSL